MASPIIQQLLDLESVRAFPNQFEIVVSGGDEKTDSIEVIKNFSFYAKRIQMGSFKVEQDRIVSVQKTILKKATIPDTLTLTVKEVSDWAIFKYFYKWYTECYYDPKANVFKVGPKGKRKTFTIYALKAPYLMTSVNAVGANDNNKQMYGLKIIVNNALLVGSVNLPSFDYDTHTPVEHTFTIQSDDIIIEGI